MAKCLSFIWPREEHYFYTTGVMHCAHKRSKSWRYNKKNNITIIRFIMLELVEKYIMHRVTDPSLFRTGKHLKMFGDDLRLVSPPRHRWCIVIDEYRIKVPPRYCFTIYEFCAISWRHVAKSRRPFAVTAYERLGLFHVGQICLHVWGNLLLDFNVFFLRIGIYKYPCRT